ncbi:hypothetical protein HMPREF1318_2889 [Actinomyces massiliensis F0489]|uniref:Uncharacterized protein n=1 Tax=Actinomyces massiliensis F0489 TaxID=1125718 RepID=J1HMX9_9ACTO|nr:hypothetical protein HMPREF1318_2889 [Actinomyces massiliensis F0489]
MAIILVNKSNYGDFSRHNEARGGIAPAGAGAVPALGAELGWAGHPLPRASSGALPFRRDRHSRTRSTVPPPTSFKNVDLNDSARVRL